MSAVEESEPRAVGRPAGRRRGVLVGVAVLALCVVGVLVSLGTGPLRVAPGDVVLTLAGRRPQYDYAVIDNGLPRALLAVLLGTALGTAGALTQALTRNPLGSPDLIGFDAGAATGALVAMLVLGATSVQVAGGAMVAGLVTAAVVFTLARGASGAGYRLILVGIAVAALLQGVNSYLLTRSDPRAALEGARWLVGSLNLAGEVDSLWEPVVLALVALALLLPAAVLLARPLRMLQMGEDVSTAAGVPVAAVQTATVVVAVLLAAVAVSVVGPITFVALVAPQLVRAVSRTPGPAVLLSGLMGGLLLLGSDLVAQRALPDVQPPVGVVTGILGGAYLAWLLTRERTLT